MKIAIVVLNWNGFEDTKACLSSLLAQDYENFSVVIVDNGSQDESRPQLENLQDKLKDDRLHIVYNQHNHGFAGGVNIGIRWALEQDYDAVALFNNDATADASWLASLVEATNRSDEIGITTGLLLHEDGSTIDSTGEFYSIWGMPFPRGRGEARDKASVSGYVFGASGGASLYKREVFESIGLFDERFFAYYEDVDISFRAQLAGFKTYYTDKAIAYHKQGATSVRIPGFTVYQTFKNIPLLYIKNVPLGLIFPIGARLFVLYWLMFGNAVKKGSGWPATKGWLASIRHTWAKSWWQRFGIQRQKNVSTDYIQSMLHPDLPPDQTGMRKLRKRLIGS